MHNRWMMVNKVLDFFHRSSITADRNYMKNMGILQRRPSGARVGHQRKRRYIKSREVAQ